MVSAVHKHVLVVDDDPHLLQALNRALSLEGFMVATAADVGQALSLIDQSWQDIIVLDVMMPVLDGVSFCRLIRDRIDTPILMLTALDSVADRVAGLDAGADDYLMKPFATSELVARLRALLRRSERTVADESEIAFADMRLDPRMRQVTRAGVTVSLTNTEFRILELLMSQPGSICNRDRIVAVVWGYESAAESNSLDVHIAGLRQKLEAGGGSRLVQTVRGVGFVLRE